MALTLTSTVFGNGEMIPERYTAQGEGVSPSLRWSEVPRDTREFALICEDPDAPTPKPFVHWILYGLSANTSALPEGIPPQGELELPVLARQGLNSLMRLGYTGPMPPPWHGPHRYRFRLFALRAPMGLLPGTGRSEFFAELEGKVIEEAVLEGLYEQTFAPRARRRLRLAQGAAAAAGMAWIAYRVIRRKGSGRKAA